MPYHWLAQYYDQFFGPFRGPIEAAREQLLAPILPHVASACDMACGTGYTVLALARRGIRVLGVDLSPAMCRAARAKLRGAGFPARIFQGDMRTFRLPEPVDLVTCEYDAINHLPRKQDLVRVAKAVARALNPGGHFFFDVNNRAGFAAYWKGSLWIEHPGAVLVMRNGNDAAHDCAWSNCEWFFQEGALWRRRHERVEEVCWSAAEVRAALARAGFSRVRAWDSAPFWGPKSGIGPGCRTIWLARKGKS